MEGSKQQPLIGLAKLMRMAFSGVDLAPLGNELIARAGADPQTADAHALMDLSTVLQLRGEHELSMVMQAQALELQQLYAPPTADGEPAIRVLAIMGRGDLMANTPLEFLLEHSDVALDILYVAPDLPVPPSLPDHDVLFVAIGESEQNLPLLAEMGEVVKTWPRPVLNQPERIAALARDNVCALLGDALGIVMPGTVRVGRQALEQIASGVSSLDIFLPGDVFPVIVRPVDSHAGQGLDKLEVPAAVEDYLRTRPESEFYLSGFVDYRGADGLFRKYRIVLIAGRPYLCHLAISAHWMIHYLNAGMDESAEKRAEEARCMETFDEDFARRHAAAFHAIHERMGFDYVGIDCGESADGRLLIFEVDSNMIVHAIDPVEVFPYKQPQMRKLFGAFREMLLNAKNRAQ
ncbi:MAG: RimK family alpha-L-glutamate ligase [Nitrosomonadales bacterium]|nr:RimK family alpha-L-glutamate ligase [Nitrosomonadales bacterium]